MVIIHDGSFEPDATIPIVHIRIANKHPNSNSTPNLPVKPPCSQHLHSFDCSSLLADTRQAVVDNPFAGPGGSSHLAADIPSVVLGRSNLPVARTAGCIDHTGVAHTAVGALARVIVRMARRWADSPCAPEVVKLHLHFARILEGGRSCLPYRVLC